MSNMRGKLKGLAKVNTLQDVTEVDEFEDGNNETSNPRRVKIALKKSSVVEKLEQELREIDFCEPNYFEPNLQSSEILLEKLIDAINADKNVLDLTNLSLNDQILGNIDLKNDHFKLGVSDDRTYNQNFSKVSTINLSQNRLRSISLEFLNLFPALERLNLSHNSMQTLNLFKNLKSLDLSSNNLVKVDELYALDQLEVLNLSSNKIQIDKNTQQVFQSMPNLRAVNLSRNHLVSLDLELFRFNRHLTQLFLSHNANISLTGFSKVNHLKLIDLSSNNFNNIPHELKQLDKLEYLYLDKNNLEFIPSELNEFGRLHVLSLSANLIRDLNDLFCMNAKFKFSLRELNLSKNSLNEERLSEQFFVFKNLSKLDLSSNKFKFIPNSLPSDLSELRLSHNNIFTLITKPIQMLEHVNFYDDQQEQEVFEHFMKINEVKSMHANVFYSKKLQILALNSNSIQEIPSSFGILNQSLVELDFSHNFIQKFDVNLCRGLVNLTKLDLSSNRINLLPEQIRELVKLEHLKLSNNRLNRLTYELCNELKNLIELDLSRNLISELPLFAFKRNNQVYTSTTLTRVFSSKETQELVESNSFTFNLDRLQSINLSFNMLCANVPLHKIFGLCKNLASINLSSNQLESIDINNNDYHLDYENSDMVLSKLNYLNLSNNKLLLSKGGFIKLLLNFYKFGPNLSDFEYDQAHGNKLGDAQELYFEIDNDLKLNRFYLHMKQNLKHINLSNNNLARIPTFLYFMKNLKRITLNDNSIERIPRELVNGRAYKSVKQGENDDLDIEMNKNLEIIELNNNKLEQIPENFFHYFKRLKQIDILNNPLKEPPKEAIWIGLDKEDIEYWNKKFNSLQEEETRNENDSRIKPIKSYMLKFKQREETLLCNMFNIIQDEIKSKETLLKLMRRLKMPMDKVDLVCKDIDELMRNSTKNSKLKNKSKPKRAQAARELHMLILRIQTWKLLNIWRHLYGTDASTDELIRILKLMCSNELEESILEKVTHVKNVANILRI